MKKKAKSSNELKEIQKAIAWLPRVGEARIAHGALIEGVTFEMVRRCDTPDGCMDIEYSLKATVLGVPCDLVDSLCSFEERRKGFLTYP